MMDITTKGSLDFRDKVISLLKAKLNPLTVEDREARFEIIGLEVAQELKATMSAQDSDLTFIERSK